MSLVSPAAAVTDLCLGLTGLALAARTLNHFRSTGARRSGWWSLGYAALGLGSVLGFVTLGFRTGLEQPITYVSRFAIGVAVLAMLTAVVEGLAGPRRARPWRLLFLLAFAAYYGATLLTGSFLVFVLYSGTALLATLVLEGYRWLVRLEAGAGLMALGMALSMAAAGLQATRLSFTLLWTFDHNAIYHMLQLVALLILYRGLMAGGGRPSLTQSA